MASSRLPFVLCVVAAPPTVAVGVRVAVDVAVVVAVAVAVAVTVAVAVAVAVGVDVGGVPVTVGVAVAVSVMVGVAVGGVPVGVGVAVGGVPVGVGVAVNAADVAVASASSSSSPRTHGLKPGPPPVEPVWMWLSSPQPKPGRVPPLASSRRAPIFSSRRLTMKGVDVATAADAVGVAVNTMRRSSPWPRDLASWTLLLRPRSPRSPWSPGAAEDAPTNEISKAPLVTTAAAVCAM